MGFLRQTFLVTKATAAQEHVGLRIHSDWLGLIGRGGEDQPFFPYLCILVGMGGDGGRSETRAFGATQTWL